MSDKNIVIEISKIDKNSYWYGGSSIKVGDIYRFYPDTEDLIPIKSVRVPLTGWASREITENSEISGLDGVYCFKRNDNHFKDLISRRYNR